MWSSPIWSIYGNDSLKLVQRAINGDLPEITQGPAADAQAIGLPIDVRDGVGIVRLNGPMLKRVGALGRMFGLAGTDSVTQAVRSAAADPAVETIMLSVDSPGGSVDGLAELGDAVRAAAKIKPVIAQVDGMAASAAYYAIAGATEIRAGRMDLVGSIGTKLVLWDTSKAFADAGIEVVAFDTGPLKSAGEPGLTLTDTQREYFQGLVDAYFTDFKAQVAMGRGMSAGQIKAVTTGAVWTATDAMDLGLVDKVATFRETFGELMGVRQQRRSRVAANVRLLKLRAGTYSL